MGDPINKEAAVDASITPQPLTPEQAAKRDMNELKDLASLIKYSNKSKESRREILEFIDRLHAPVNTTFTFDGKETNLLDLATQSNLSIKVVTGLIDRGNAHEGQSFSEEQKNQAQENMQKNAKEAGGIIKKTATVAFDQTKEFGATVVGAAAGMPTAGILTSAGRYIGKELVGNIAGIVTGGVGAAVGTAAKLAGVKTKEEKRLEKFNEGTTEVKKPKSTRKTIRKAIGKTAKVTYKVGKAIVDTINYLTIDMPIKALTTTLRTVTPLGRKWKDTSTLNDKKLVELLTHSDPGGARAKLVIKALENRITVAQEEAKKAGKPFDIKKLLDSPIQFKEKKAWQTPWRKKTEIPTYTFMTAAAKYKHKEVMDFLEKNGIDPATSKRINKAGVLHSAKEYDHHKAMQASRHHYASEIAGGAMAAAGAVAVTHGGAIAHIAAHGGAIALAKAGAAVAQSAGTSLLNIHAADAGRVAYYGLSSHYYDAGRKAAARGAIHLADAGMQESIKMAGISVGAVLGLTGITAAAMGAQGKASKIMVAMPDGTIVKASENNIKEIKNERGESQFGMARGYLNPDERFIIRTPRMIKAATGEPLKKPISPPTFDITVLDYQGNLIGQKVEQNGKEITAEHPDYKRGVSSQDPVWLGEKIEAAKALETELQAAREQAAKEQAAKEQAAKEQAEKEQAIQEEAAKQANVSANTPKTVTDKDGATTTVKESQKLTNDKGEYKAENGIVVVKQEKEKDGLIFNVKPGSVEPGVDVVVETPRLGQDGKPLVPPVFDITTLDHNGKLVSQKIVHKNEKGEITGTLDPNDPTIQGTKNAQSAKWLASLEPSPPEVSISTKAAENNIEPAEPIAAISTRKTPTPLLTPTLTAPKKESSVTPEIKAPILAAPVTAKPTVPEKAPMKVAVPHPKIKTTLQPKAIAVNKQEAAQLRYLASLIENSNKSKESEEKILKHVKELSAPANADFRLGDKKTNLLALAAKKGLSVEVFAEILKKSSSPKERNFRPYQVEEVRKNIRANKKTGIVGAISRTNAKAERKLKKFDEFIKDTRTSTTNITPSTAGQKSVNKSQSQSH